MKVKILTTIGILLLILGLLLTSFQLAIYGDADYGFYEREYKSYGVAKILNMTDSDVMKVTEYMMAYLIGKEEELTIDVMVDGEYQDFFNEQDRLHMADVRNLFLGGLKLRNFCIIASVLLLILIALGKFWSDKKLGVDRFFLSMGSLYFWGHLRALFIIAFFAIIIAVACALDFDSSFRLFHKLFFTNDLWIFDPTTDYMINMLPEGFFFDFVIRIAGIFGGLLLLLTFFFGAIAFIGSRIGSRKGSLQKTD